MLSKTVNGVTVEVTNEIAGRRMAKWIIESIRIEGLPDMRLCGSSYASAEEAIDAGFQIGNGVLISR